MKTRSRTTRISIALLIAGLLLGACASEPNGSENDGRALDGLDGGGSAANPVALIRAVSKRVADEGSFRATFEMRIEAQGQTIAATGEGEFSDDPLAVHASYRFGELPGMPAGMEMEMILDGSTMYMKMPELSRASGLPEGWISMDLDELAPGFSELASLSQGQNDPSSSVEYLRGITDAEAVGTEDVAGVETTHFRGTIDLAKAYDKLPGGISKKLRESVEQAVQMFGDAAMPVDIWIDGDGLPRRMSFELSPTKDAVPAVSMSMTIEFPEYGIDVDLPIPAAKDVTDISQLAHVGGDW
jgi:hypothetical protein